MITLIIHFDTHCNKEQCIEKLLQHKLQNNWYVCLKHNLLWWKIRNVVEN